MWSTGEVTDPVFVRSLTDHSDLTGSTPTFAHMSPTIDPVPPRRRRRTLAGSAVVVMLLMSCGSSPDDAATTVEPAVASTTSEEPTSTPTDEAVGTEVDTADAPQDDNDQAMSTFRIDVWADNWMAVSIDGTLIGEDSVPITTERSFNAESFTFDATYPFTVAIEAKDFKQTDSGIEYIGQNNQQMGDGGLIAQVTDTSTGEVVAVSDAAWSTLVVHRAPLNPECTDDPDPDATCEFEITETPTGWTAPGFDDSAWNTATEWSAADVGPKGGYLDIDWDDSAQLIWGSDLEIDNTVLTRLTVVSK